MFRYVFVQKAFPTKRQMAKRQPSCWRISARSPVGRSFCWIFKKLMPAAKRPALESSCSGISCFEPTLQRSQDNTRSSCFITWEQNTNRPQWLEAQGVRSTSGWKHKWLEAEREKSKLLHIVERLFSGGRVRSRRFETQMMKLLPSKPFCQNINSAHT